MGNSTIDIMRASALENLYAGCVMPWDKQILEDMPLPADMVDPFASEEVKPLSVMNLTYVSLSGWIAEAKKASYYSERFVYLSKLVQKGVTTMGRGLVTLHKRGEDLSAAPMQIDDLISVGSYHFRKSYLGVVQFSSKHPEIGERLLVNQLGWADLLMRLYKTKEKLSEKSEIRNQKSDMNGQLPAGGNEEVRSKNEELPSAGAGDQGAGASLNKELPASLGDDSSFFIHNSSLDDASALSGLDALFAPAAFSAQRALTSLPGNKKSEIRNKKSEENEEGRRKKEEKQVSGSSCQVSEKESEAGANEEGRRKNEEKQVSGSSRQVSEKESEDKENEKERLEHEEAANDEADESSFLPLHSSLDEDSSLENLPLYLVILQQVFARSGPEDEGQLTFTEDEIRLLASDPDFNRIYPEAAADMMRILQQIDST